MLSIKKKRSVFWQIVLLKKEVPLYLSWGQSYRLVRRFDQFNSLEWLDFFSPQKIMLINPPARHLSRSCSSGAAQLPAVEGYD